MDGNMKVLGGVLIAMCTIAGVYAVYLATGGTPIIK
jgi:hypothetical protein